MFAQILAAVSGAFAAATNYVGVDVGEIVKLKEALHKLLPDLIVAAQATGADNATKRKAVLDGVAHWYDVEILPKDLPGPDCLVDPMLKAGLLAAADQLVDFGVELLKRSGELKKA